MSIPTQGPVSFSELQAEFGGSSPISLGEYYRGGVYVPVGLNTDGIPASGAINVLSFRGKTPNATFTYEIIGGGGGGGYGVNDGGGSGVAPSGGNTVISYLSTTITSSGGAGGANGAISRLQFHGGEASYYGAGGLGGNNNSAGGDAPATSYGAGGGGGGGDAPSVFDSSGNAGIGGYASTRITGTSNIRYGTSVNMTVGAGGAGSTSGYAGGDGASGRIYIVVDGTATEYATAGSYNRVL